LRLGVLVSSAGNFFQVTIDKELSIFLGEVNIRDKKDKPGVQREEQENFVHDA
jgi:hypothetical protein